LKFGNGEDFNPRNGTWSFNNKVFVSNLSYIFIFSAFVINNIFFLMILILFPENCATC